MKEKQAKPFLKWAEGKSQLLDDIKGKLLYEKNDNFTYVERAFCWQWCGIVLGFE